MVVSVSVQFLISFLCFLSLYMWPSGVSLRLWWYFTHRSILKVFAMLLWVCFEDIQFRGELRICGNSYTELENPLVQCFLLQDNPWLVLWELLPFMLSYGFTWMGPLSWQSDERKRKEEKWVFPIHCSHNRGPYS